MLFCRSAEFWLRVPIYNTSKIQIVSLWYKKHKFSTIHIKWPSSCGNENSPEMKHLIHKKTVFPFSPYSSIYPNDKGSTTVDLDNL